MPASKRQLALKANRRTVATFLRKYALPPLVSDPMLSEVKECHRRLLKKVHPDKGGLPEQFRAVQAARDVGRSPAPCSPAPRPALHARQGSSVVGENKMDPRKIRRSALVAARSSARPPLPRSPASAPRPPCAPDPSVFRENKMDPETEHQVERPCRRPLVRPPARSPPRPPRAPPLGVQGNIMDPESDHTGGVPFLCPPARSHATRPPTPCSPAPLPRPPRAPAHICRRRRRRRR